MKSGLYTSISDYMTLLCTEKTKNPTDLLCYSCGVIPIQRSLIR